MRSLRKIAAAPIVAAIACFGGAGMAQDRDGNSYYASASGLVVAPRDTEWSQTVANETASFDFPMQTGFGFLVAAGRSLTSGLRVEIELGYRQYDFDAGPTNSIEGQFSTLSLMANGIYSFDLQGFRPYAGIGIGLARNSAEIEPVTFIIDSESASVEGTGESDVFAYQGLAGIGYALSDRTEVLLGYRYFGTGEGDHGAGAKLSSAHHNFEIGFRYSF